MNIGQRIKQFRHEANLSIAELAKKTGVTSSYISQVERSLINPSISKLNSIVKGMGLTLGDLFNNHASQAANDHGEEVTHEYGRVNQPKAQVVRKDLRKSFFLPQSNTQYFLLSPDLNRKIEFVLIVAPPHASSGNNTICHEGEECCLILSGSMKLLFDSEEYILEEGDSAYFDSSIPHRWKNIGSQELRAICVITPPSF